MPNIAAPISSTARYAPPRLRFSTSRGGGGGSGFGAPNCQAANAASSTTPAARKPHVDGVCQLSAAALESP